MSERVERQYPKILKSKGGLLSVPLYFASSAFVHNLCTSNELPVNEEEVAVT